MLRIVQPEILDSLPADAPDAVRSRQDLRRINYLMDNFRWLERALEDAELPRGSHIVEVGSGDGAFARRMAEKGYSVTAIDLAPRPADLPKNVRWIQGDLFEELPGLSADVLIANLFWHHFNDQELARLAPLIDQFQRVLANEPLRAHFPQALGAILVPFVNHVTRHDLFVSIKAGFQRDELPRLWKLEQPRWEVEESVGLLGAYRIRARRVANHT